MRSTDFPPGTPRVQRRSNAEVVDRLTVRHAIAGVVSDIDDLQRETVLLRTLTSRWASPESYLPRIVTLGQNVRETTARFGRVVGALDERQKAHGRVQDLRRTLANLADRVPRLPAN